MGKFIELYDMDAEIMHTITGCVLKKNYRAMKTAFGFPRHKKLIFLNKALEKGYPAAILEEGKPGKWIRHRYIGAIYDHASIRKNL